MSNYINPQSQCILINVPIENDYKNQYSFSSLQAQESFFKSKKVTGKEFTNLTFIRDGEISVEGSYNEIYMCNYLMFQNTGFSNKWFYAFITDVDYVNENCSVIHYELDYFQTWYFDINYKTSFVLREHVADDTIGKNVIDEGLDYGEYIYRQNATLIHLSTYSYIVCTTELINGDDPSLIKIYDNIANFLHYYYAKTSTDLLAILGGISNTESILYINAVPTEMAPEQEEGEITLPTNSKGITNEIITSLFINSSDIENYVPKNNKLFCFPYNVIEMTNNQGQSAIYRPELFPHSLHLRFRALSNIIGNPTVIIYPVNYKLGYNLNNNNDFINEGISIQDFPKVAINNDFYKNYLALNSYGNNIKLGLNIGNSLLTGGIGLATGNPIGVGMGVSSFANAVGNYMAENHKAEVTPNNAKNSQTGNPLSAQGKTGIFLNFKSITKNYAIIIDNFFSTFGYKVNEMKIPQFNSRQNWNYIETKNINITGNIPQNHLNKIKEMFNHGVTIWHNDNVGNYNRTNPIV